MSRINNFFSFLAIISVTILSLVLFSLPAQALTYNYSWKGNGGYSATGSFSYDENTAPLTTFSEKGFGQTNILQSLKVSFFDSENHLIAAYDNVVNGISTAHFFSFNFNPVSQEIFGFIDLGGEIGGDIYLKGTVNTDLSLFQVLRSGSEVIVDSKTEIFVAQAVPESISFLNF